MQKRVATLCVLATIGVGVYCAHLSHTIRRLSNRLGRVEQEQFLRDELSSVRRETFIVPPSDSVRIRLVFSVAGEEGDILLLADTLAADRTREYTFIKEFDPTNEMRCGFIVREGNAGTIRQFGTVRHKRLTAEEIRLMLGASGGSTYRGFGAHGPGTCEVADGRLINYRYEVSR